MHFRITNAAHEMFNSDLNRPHPRGALIKLAHMATPLTREQAQALLCYTTDRTQYLFVPDWEGRMLVFAVRSNGGDSGTVVAVKRIHFWMEHPTLSFDEMDDIVINTLQEVTPVDNGEAEDLTGCDHCGNAVLSPCGEWVITLRRHRVHSVDPVLYEMREAA